MTRRALAEKRNQLRSLRVTRLSKSILLSLATLGTFLVMMLLVLDQMYRPESFQVKEIHIKGKVNHVDPELLVQKVKAHLENNFFTLDLNQVKQVVEQVKWVDQAQARRRWPSILEIEVQEHRPLVRWNDSSWLTSKGEVVDLDYEANNQNRVLANYSLNLESVRLSGSHAWTLTVLDSLKGARFEILLGQEQFNERFQRVVDWYRVYQIRLDRQNLKRVDARYPDGLAVLDEVVSEEPRKTGTQEALNEQVIRQSSQSQMSEIASIKSRGLSYSM